MISTWHIIGLFLLFTAATLAGYAIGWWHHREYLRETWSGENLQLTNEEY